MIRDLFIVGCGGFGREVADIVNSINDLEPTWNLVGFFDDAPSANDIDRVSRLGLEILGPVSAAAKSPANWHYAIGIGNGSVREAVASVLDGVGGTPTTLIHPTATVGADSSFAPGVIVCAGVAITTNVAVGRHSHINLNSTIGHDAAIGDYVTINPIVAISGNCVLEKGSTLGTHSAVIPGLTVGAAATVGAASCVVKDVPPNTTVKGVPAR